MWQVPLAGRNKTDLLSSCQFRLKLTLLSILWQIIISRPSLRGIFSYRVAIKDYALTHTGIFLSFHPMHRRACSHALGSPACCFSKNVIVKELFREITVSSRDVTTYPLICLLIEQTPTALKFFRMRGYDFKSGFGNLTSERQAQDVIQTNALLKITPSLSLRCKQLN